MSGNFLVYSFFENSIIAFSLFCLASSSVYIFNDLLDLNRDKEHSVKKNRPLSSGRISRQRGIFILLVLLSLIILIGYFNSFTGYKIISAYLILNFLYTTYLKHVEIIDVICISIGFVLRVSLGVVFSKLDTSLWLIGLTFSLSMLLALGKRKAEIKSQASTKVRPSLRRYNSEIISQLQIIFVTVTLIFYVMYTLFNQTFPGDRELLFYSSIFVTAGLGRYMMITSSDSMIEEPTNIVYQDRFILFTVLCWGLYLALCIYSK